MIDMCEITLDIMNKTVNCEITLDMCEITLDIMNMCEITLVFNLFI